MNAGAEEGLSQNEVDGGVQAAAASEQHDSSEMRRSSNANQRDEEVNTPSNRLSSLAMPPMPENELVRIYNSDASKMELFASNTFEEFDLLPLQNWYFNLNLPNFNQLCQAITICLPEEHDLSVEEIEDALEELMNSHDMLRATFNVQDRKARVTDFGEAQLSFVDLRETEMSDEDLLGMFDSINIEQGPLWRAVLHSGFKLFMVFHQLIIDEVSCLVLAEWVYNLLAGKSLRQVPCSYERWVKYVYEYADSNHLTHVPFWETMLTGVPNAKLAKVNSEVAEFSFELSVEDTTTLLKTGQAKCAGLAALGQALADAFDTRATPVGLNDFGRSSSIVDVSSTVGLFYSFYPALVDGTGGFEKVFQRVQKLMRSVPEQGIGFAPMVRLGFLPRKIPQVNLVFVTKEKWNSVDLDPEWSVVPFYRFRLVKLPLLVGMASLSVVCVVKPSGCLSVRIASQIADEGMAVFCESFQRSLGNAVAFFRNGNGSSLEAGPVFRKSVKPHKSKRVPPTGEKRRMKGKSIRSSRIVRNYRKTSIVDNEYLFFVHPFGRDAGVYKPLAKALFAQGFNPRGIDDDVFTSTKHDEMAHSLEKLGAFYADLVVSAMSKASDNAPVHLCGWSLGGKIALEAAAALERLGRSQIVVFLLDSFLSLSGNGGSSQGLAEGIMSDPSSSLGNGQLEQRRRMVENECKLADQPLSRPLRQTKVVLLKAGKVPEESSPWAEVLRNNVKSFDNGFSQGVQRLTVIRLGERDHFNIVSALDEIIETIAETVMRRIASESRD